MYVEGGRLKGLQERQKRYYKELQTVDMLYIKSGDLCCMFYIIYTKAINNNIIQVRIDQHEMATFLQSDTRIREVTRY